MRNSNGFGLVYERDSTIWQRYNEALEDINSLAMENEDLKAENRKLTKGYARLENELWNVKKGKKRSLK